MNMSFAMTIDQIKQQTKTVTRRVWWQQAKPGQIVVPVEKTLGLRKGEKVKPINPGLNIQFVDVRREPLRAMLADPEYGQQECAKEGFAHLTPSQFVDMLLRSQRGTSPDMLVTRIEFVYLAAAPKHLSFDGQQWTLRKDHHIWLGDGDLRCKSCQYINESGQHAILLLCWDADKQMQPPSEIRYVTEEMLP